ISQIASEVTSISPTATRHTRAAQGLFRGYKDTVFISNSEVIASVKLNLRKASDPTRVETHMHSCASARLRAGHFRHPSCGCVFKNDYSIGVPSGLLLELAGAKQLRMGGASVN